MDAFEIDRRLSQDTILISKLGLCELRLMNDRRWPWLIMVPQRADIVEFHDLTPLDQTMLTFETALVAKALKEVSRAEKINIGALGNIVSMFHMHVVARSSGDTNWPHPVWGFGSREPYEEDAANPLVERIRTAVLQA